MITAYDYDKQTWTQGEPARFLRIKQLTADLELLTGPDGERFARFTGIQDMNETIARMKEDLRNLTPTQELTGGRLSEWY